MFNSQSSILIRGTVSSRRFPRMSIENRELNIGQILLLLALCAGFGSLGAVIVRAYNRVALRSKTCSLSTTLRLP
jgi:hypothetical protein